MSMIDSVAEQLRQDTAAVRLSRSRFGAKKAITKEQRDSAASIFYAEANMLSASKKLLDTKAEAYKNVTAILSRAVETWKFFTVPYPESGIRLIKRERVESFQNQMIGLQAELDQAVAALNDEYYQLRNKARTSLGNLFDPSDYPDNLDDEFSLAWEFPSVEPPLYLKELNPKLYEQEEERIRRRFEEAVILTEQAFIEEFAKLLGNLADKLTGLDDNGCQKAFRDSSVEKLGEFFQRFKALNVRSNPELDALVEQAKNCVSGQSPDALRHNSGIRFVVGEALKQVNANLETMLVKRPKRAISLRDDD